MKATIKNLTCALLTVSLCLCVFACTNTGENDSLSGLANEKCSNRDLGLAEYGDYVFFVGKTMQLNSDGSSSNVMRCERDGSNLVLLGDTAKYTEIISKTESDVSMAEPVHLEYISGGRLYIRFAVTFARISGDNNGDNSDTIEMICDLDMDGDDLHIDAQYTDHNPADAVSCSEDSASDGSWTYYSVIDEVIDSESKIYREKIDQT